MAGRSFVYRQGRKSTEGVAANKLADEMARELGTVNPAQMRALRAHAEAIIKGRRKESGS